MTILVELEHQINCDNELIGAVSGDDQHVEVIKSLLVGMAGSASEMNMISSIVQNGWWLE